MLSKTSEGGNYYQRIEDIELTKSIQKIDSVLQEGLKDEIITKEELNAMSPWDKKPARFYCLSKIHKEHTPPHPPVRPIISGSGSLTENIGIYVEHHIKQIAKTHKAYLQDTPHLLRIIEKINNGPKLPTNTILATTDIIGAYQNIPQDDGIETFKQVLEQRDSKEVPSNFLVERLTEADSQICE